MLVSSALADQDLGKQSQNPIGNMISLPMQNNTYFGVGPAEEWANSFQLQPVYPVSFGKINLINRGIIPVNYIAEQEGIIPTSTQVENSVVTFSTDSVGGLGNITYQGFFSPAKPGKVIWGAGPVIQFPTATDDHLGTDKWSGGPGFVALAMPGNWVLGVLGYNLWSFAGPSDEENVNFFLFQYFFNYNLSNVWSNSASSPLISRLRPSGTPMHLSMGPSGHYNSWSNFYFPSNVTVSGCCFLGNDNETKNNRLNNLCIKLGA
jgi:hypothetical protein